MTKAIKLGLLAFGLALSGATQASALDVTDCTAANPNINLVNKKTIINLPAEDIVIKCPLMSLGGNGQVQVIGQSIIVDGPNTGSVMSSGKGAKATLLRASGDITIDAANVVAANGNGNVVVDSGGNVAVTAGSSLQAGSRVSLNCSAAACTVTVVASSIMGNKIAITASGDVVISPTSTLMTTSPRDEISITSNTGNVIIAGGGALGSGTLCCQAVLQACQPDPSAPSCPLSSGPITLTTFSEVMAFCADCDSTPSQVSTGVEGNITVLAPLGFIDVSNTLVTAGETIIMTALLRIDADGSSISNCGPKSGVVVLTSVSSNCEIEGATILDDDPQTAPTLSCTQVGTPTLLGTCSSKHP